MIKKNQEILNFINVLLDFLLILFSYIIAVFIRFNMLHGHRSVEPLSGAYLIIVGIFSMMLVTAYAIGKMYNSQRFKRPGYEVLAVIFINAVGVLALMAILFVSRAIDYSRLTMLLLWLISSALVSTKHVVTRVVLQHYRVKGYNQKHVVVVGNGHLAHQYIQNINDNPQMGFTVDGYISAVQKPELGKCLGSYEDTDVILDKLDIDDVVVALEPHEVIFMKDILAAADKEGLHVSVIPFYNDYIPPHPSIDVVGDTKLINMRATPLDNMGWSMTKRLIDVVGSLCMIVVTSPIMLITAIGVKISSPGPILFKQERVGKNKKNFRMLKFRSMRVTNTQDTGWSTNNDPRKTKFGSFIRKYSIDELPQLFNVLKGEMSLVGPRPEVPFHVSHFKEEIPLYLVRQQVRPGMTGWAQVNGWRGDTDIKERVNCDIWYIENWSLGLDIKILFKTAFGGIVNSETINVGRTETEEELVTASKD